MNTIRRTALCLVIALAALAAPAVAQQTTPQDTTPHQALLKQREKQDIKLQGWHREYVRLATLAKEPVRQVKYNGPKIARAIQDQQIHERRVHLWQRRVYAQLLSDMHDRVAYKKTTKFLYEVLNEDGVRAMVYAAFDQKGVDEHGRYCITGIIRGESNWDPAADNPKSTALGLMQFLDFWGKDWERADPVWSILRVIRYYQDTGNFQPWVLTKPSGC